jgi:hypothetical protein
MLAWRNDHLLEMKLEKGTFKETAADVSDSWRGRLAGVWIGHLGRFGDQGIGSARGVGTFYHSGHLADRVLLVSDARNIRFSL